jgi:uncharacterized protein (TIGR00255 family)
MPMLLSMTGFGRGEVRTEQGSLQVEIRSVNHRFSELSIRLPRGLALLESRVRERIQAHLSRGKVTVSIGMDGEESEMGRLTLNHEVARGYFQIMKALKEDFGLSGEADLAAFLTLPDVLTWEREHYAEDVGWRLLLPALDQAIEDILSMKRREGETLGRDLLGRLDLMDSALDRVEERVPEMIASLRHRLQDRLGEAGSDLEYNRSRVETEIVLFADRTDCTEECVRLRSHLDMFRDLIRAPEAAGRKLNFLLQEMNREANTIGSKAQDVGIAREVIALKEEIEKIREQVQNFE